MKISDFAKNADKMFEFLRNKEELVHEQTESDNVDQSESQESENPELLQDPTMVPPLQQKIELLKKSVGVDNFYDGSESEDSDSVQQPMNITINIPKGQSQTKIDLTVNGNTIDPVDRVKKLAGIPAAAIFTAGDDEPLDS